MKLTGLILVAFSILFFMPESARSLDDKTVVISVRTGDYLIHICELYLKNPMKWNEIARLNKVKNPNLIYPGQRLTIPVELIRGTPADGTVTFLKGEVLLQEKKEGNWRAVEQYEKISAGTAIKTGEDGSVEISYDNGIAILLRSNTKLTLLITRKIDGLHILFQYFLKLGKSITKIKEAIGYDSRFTIETPSVVAGARGTDFRLTNDEREITRCEVLEGTVLIDARMREIEVPAGQGMVVSKGERPQEPVRLLAPPRPAHVLELYRAMPLTFEFEKVENAGKYRIVLARDGQFKDIIKNEVINPSEKVSMISVDDGSYYLQTTSIDASGLEGPPSEPYTIRIRVNPLPPFVQSPVDHSEIRSKDVQIQWLKVADAARYHLQVSGNPDFRSFLVDETNLTGLSHQMTSLSPGSYYFRIRSIAADGFTGIWSDVISFRVMEPPPAPPLEKPEVDEKEITIRWRDLGSTIRYRFQLAKDAEFKEIMTDEIVNKPQMTIVRPEESGVYYVRTSGVDPTGYEGDFSLPQSFEVKKKFPFRNVGIFLGSVLLMIILL